MILLLDLFKNHLFSVNKYLVTFYSSRNYQAQYSKLKSLNFSGVNCTQADLEAIIAGNDDVVLLGLDTDKLYYEYTYKFKCNETGKSFKNTDTNEYQTYVTATCQANKTWSISTIPYQCECE